MSKGAAPETPRPQPEFREQTLRFVTCRFGYESSLDEAERADRIGLIRAGKLIEEGTPKDLKAKYQVDTIEEIFLILSKGEVYDE